MSELKLSHNIIRLRHEKKLTQKELADFLGVTKASVSKWENAQNTPDILLLPQIAAFFGVTIDELIGYEAQLSSEQIRRCYAGLRRDFASQPFEEARERVRDLAHRYYACYPLLLQLGVLYWNHYMLADTEEERGRTLEEAVGWCDRILENCNDVEVCSDALVLRSGLYLQMGRPEETIRALEPSAEPGRLAGQNRTLLIQAYQMAGKLERARSFAQTNQYLSLLDLIGDAVLYLSLYEHDLERCEETIRRVTGLLELYKLEQLHPNIAAQFYYQAAAVYAVNGKKEKVMEALFSFERDINVLLGAEEILLHGDSYFDLLDVWIDQLPLGSMAPRDRALIRQNILESLSLPAFDCVREDREYQNLIRRLTNGGALC
ncbi:MAG: helix-turn-helix transcriptional regulator [Eubacterium sp.]|nr:helix-turn-helix transcriptional regulator [Eubacterium sp.]